MHKDSSTTLTPAEIQYATYLPIPCGHLQLLILRTSTIIVNPNKSLLAFAYFYPQRLPISDRESTKCTHCQVDSQQSQHNACPHLPHISPSISLFLQRQHPRPLAIQPTLLRTSTSSSTTSCFSTVTCAAIGTSTHAPSLQTYLLRCPQSRRQSFTNLAAEAVGVPRKLISA